MCSQRLPNLEKWWSSLAQASWSSSVARHHPSTINQTRALDLHKSVPCYRTRPDDPSPATSRLSCSNLARWDETSIMSGTNSHDALASASSSSHSPAANTPTSDDRDEIDFLGPDDNEQDHRPARPQDADVYDDDPIHGGLGVPLSFKRRPKPSLLSAPGRFFANLAAGANRTLSPQRHASPRPAPRSISPGRRGPSVSTNAAAKGGSLDWHVEGPGRRVGYEDLTAIDWIFEYTKERQRLRVLASSASGIVGWVQHLLDASQVWIILLLTGISVGAIAAAIDITSDWLGDLKTGYCSSGPEGGHFYLSKSFCCYGYDQGSHCDGWKPWSEAMGIDSGVGGWFVEYFYYVIFSVCFSLRKEWPGSDDEIDHTCLLRGRSGSGVRYLRPAQWCSRDQDATGRLRHAPLPGAMDTGHQVLRPRESTPASGPPSLTCVDPRRRIRHVVRQGRPPDTRGLLLRQPVHETLP